MCKKWIIGLILGLLSCTNLLAQNSDAILGRWMNEKKETIIEIYEENDIYHGRVVWLKDSLDVFGDKLRDVLNSNTKLRSRKVLGTKMLDGFVWDGTDSWRKGQIYFYHSGNEYNGKIMVSPQGELKLKGYYSFLFFLGKTQTWTRPTKSVHRD
ncbi:MAG: DUF2147 domain-containing protein [Flavobacteriales bacterium]|nr:DUF2147 domain-containing protein [Flavobacteriales bacterium]